MQRKPSWEVISHSEITCHLWNLKAWCRKSWVQDQPDSLQSFLQAFPFKQTWNFVKVKCIPCLCVGVQVTCWTVCPCVILSLVAFTFSSWAETSMVKNRIRIHKPQQWILQHSLLKFWHCSVGKLRVFLYYINVILLFQLRNVMMNFQKARCWSWEWCFIMII
jgi:hypothetical protein